MITVQELKEREGAHIIDVRSAEEFAQGHVPGAINIPLDDVQKLTKAVTDDTILICRTDGRSSMARQVLGKGVVVKGGTNAWKEAGYPLE